MFHSCVKLNKTSASSSRSFLQHSLRHVLSVCVILLIVSLFVNATPHFLDNDDDDGIDEQAFLVADKRPARLSYFRAPYNGGYVRGRYNANGYHSYVAKNDWWRKKAVNRHGMPWENLPNTNCLRKFCRTDNDCCRRYSKCNEEARVCYDCWYGHPCTTNTDCCERYPICNPVLRSCGK